MYAHKHAQTDAVWEHCGFKRFKDSRFVEHQPHCTFTYRAHSGFCVLGAKIDTSSWLMDKPANIKEGCTLAETVPFCFGCHGGIAERSQWWDLLHLQTGVCLLCSFDARTNARIFGVFLCFPMFSVTSWQTWIRGVRKYKSEAINLYWDWWSMTLWPVDVLDFLVTQDQMPRKVKPRPKASQCRSRHVKMFQDCSHNAYWRNHGGLLSVAKEASWGWNEMSKRKTQKSSLRKTLTNFVTRKFSQLLLIIPC